MYRLAAENSPAPIVESQGSSVLDLESDGIRNEPH